MKNIKKFLIVPLVVLVFGLLPQINVFADELKRDENYYIFSDSKYTDLVDYWSSDFSVLSENPDNPFDGNLSFEFEIPDEYKGFKKCFVIKYRYKTEYKIIYYFSDTLEVEVGYGTSKPSYRSLKLFTSSDYGVIVYNWQGEKISGSIDKMSTDTRWQFTSYSGYNKFETPWSTEYYEYLGFIYEDGYFVDDDRLEELPSSGNGILITAPKNNSKINKLEYNDRGYLEQVFTLKVQYKPNDKSFFGVNDNQQKLDVIKGITCTMDDSDFDYHIFEDSFKWIVKPSKAVDSVSSPYAVAEMKISTVFKDLGIKKFTVSSALKVSDDSTDITRDIRIYFDSINIEFVSDENYNDGVVINPDGTTGSDGSNSDINLDGFPTAPGSNSTIIDWVKYLGDVIIWLVTYPFKLLSNCFTVLGVYITVMLKTLQSTSEQITGLFTFIPKDILNVTYGIISFTLLYSVIRGLLRLIRGN